MAPSTMDTTSTYGNQTDAGDTSATTYSTEIFYERRTRVSRTILVSHPEDWSEDEHAEWVNLVNEKTNTGWKVQMTIHGSVVIHDPSIERMTLQEFIPILKERASPEDIKMIDEFIGVHNIG